MTRPRRTIAAIVAVLVLAAGCASVPPGSETLTRQARSFTPPAGRANLYALRQWSVFESGIVWPVTLDFREFGNVGQRSYLYGTLAPGRHVLGANLPGPVPNRVTFTAEAGRNYFFALVPTPGWLAGVIRIAPLDEAAGRALIEGYTLSADNRFEFDQ